MIREQRLDPVVALTLDVDWAPDHAIDAVDIASPRATHARMVEAAAARGIDALCQKPLTPTLTEAQALAQQVAGKIRPCQKVKMARFPA